MPIKTIMRYHPIPVRMVIIKKSANNNKCWRGCGEKGTLLHYRWDWCSHYGEQYGAGSLKKLKIELPYDPAIPLLGIYLEKTPI